MNISRRLLLVLATVALVAAACGQSRPVASDDLSEPDVTVGTDDPAASDGGQGDSPSTTFAPLPPAVIEVTERDDSVPAAVLAFPDGSVVEVTGEKWAEIVGSVTDSERFAANVYGGSFGKADEGFILGQLIMSELFKYSLNDLGAEVDPTVVETSKAGLTENLVQAMASEADPEAAAAEVASEVSLYLDSLSELIARQEAISGALVGDAEGQEVETYCARHILVESESEANDLMSQLADGGDFATLAAEFSLDPGSGAQGGDLGCNDPTVFVEPFADAMVAADLDQVVGPVESQFGFHIITVYDVKTEIIPQDPGELFNVVIEELGANTSIEIDPVLGVWDSQTLSVVAAS